LRSIGQTQEIKSSGAAKRLTVSGKPKKKNKYENNNTQAS
jgi:hypothetical protein